MLDFAAAIKGASEKRGILEMPAPLLGRPDLGSSILVRKAYPMLLKSLQLEHAKTHKTKFVITGQPGIGKTFWLIWLLIR